MSNKKYKIITTIEDDVPPTSGINWCTISFLTPQKIEKTKYLDVKGFKVYNGYNAIDLANEDAKKIKDNNKNHDVYLSQIGKIYPWDDATKTDNVEYDNEKLNDMEKTRKENVDKIKLIKEQFKNEYKMPHNNNQNSRKEAVQKSLQKKLYDKGLISQKEYEMLQEENKPVKEVKDMAAELEKLHTEMDECYKTDYLDESNPGALKFGCLSIYSPKHIGGLKSLLFKVRGLFQTMAQLNKHIQKLEKMYPNDRIYRFEVGKWCAFSEKDNIEPIILLKQLNYAMKCYMDNMANETESFQKRMTDMQNQATQEADIVNKKNKREKRKKKKQQQEDKSAVDNERQEIVSMGNDEDDANIQKILEYLDDPELANKYQADKSSLVTTEANIN